MSCSVVDQNNDGRSATATSYRRKAGPQALNSLKYLIQPLRREFATGRMVIVGYGYYYNEKTIEVLVNCIEPAIEPSLVILEGTKEVAILIHRTS